MTNTKRKRKNAGRSARKRDRRGNLGNDLMTQLVHAKAIGEKSRAGCDYDFWQGFTAGITHVITLLTNLRKLKQYPK